MNRLTVLILPAVICGMLALTSHLVSTAFADEQPVEKAITANDPSSQTPAKTALSARAESRERAEMLHEIVNHTLLAVHDNYYREDEGIIIPATTLRRVFDRFKEGVTGVPPVNMGVFAACSLAASVDLGGSD